METYPQTRWDLSGLLEAPSGEPLDRALQDIETRTGQFEAARAKLKPEIDEEEFLDLVKEFEDLNRSLRLVGSHAELWFTEDTQNQTALAFKAKMEQLSATVANRVMFFMLWWKEVDDANATRLMRNAGDYTYFLESERMFKKHTLTEPVEQVINIKDVNGMGGLLTVYDMITNKYQFTLTIDGQEKKLTQGEIMIYSRHPDPAIRAAAYHEMLAYIPKTVPCLRRFMRTASTIGKPSRSNCATLIHRLQRAIFPTTCPTPQSPPCSKSAAKMRRSFNAISSSRQNGWG